MQRNTILIAIIAGCLLAAGFRFFIFTGDIKNYGDNDPNFPDGAYYICENPACGVGFNLTMKALGDHHRDHFGEPVPCPKCGQTNITRAELDKTSGAYWRVGREGRFGEPVTKTQ